MNRQGFSLLETLLALVIFVASLATIAQLLDSAVRASLEARRLTQAAMLCQSKMAEVVAGSEALDSVSQTTFEDAPQWAWSMDVTGGPVQGMLTITVTVQEAEARATPVSFSLTRWMRDPEYLLEQLESAAAAEEEGP